MSNDSTGVIRAAGALIWRHRFGRLEVAVVHRDRYDDWSWPKGKLDDGEDWPAAAAREVWEETGLHVRLGLVLPTASYQMPARGNGSQEKEVRYWTAQVVGGRGRLRHEVDAVRWVPPDKARRLLTYARDADQLDALVDAHASGALLSWPLIMLRHAKARPRRSWSKNDWLRPLDSRGQAQSQDLVPVLTAYGIHRLVTSSSTRCVHTLAPYAKSTGLKLRPSEWLSEEGYEERPDLAADTLTALLERGEPAVLCSHGPVLPPLLQELIARSEGAEASTLEQACEKFAKGEAIVVHVRGLGAKAAVVAVERHLPLR